MLPAGATARGPLRLAARTSTARPACSPRCSRPPVAAYTAVLLADTATPSWHAAYRELPFVFVGSAAAASAGFGLVDRAGRTRPAPPAGWPSAARSLELVAEQQMERSMGITAEPLHHGQGRDG